MNNDIIILNNNVNKLNNDNKRANNDIDKYKKHIMFLTEINQKLMQELENIVNRDQQLKDVLSKGDHIENVLVQTEQEIDEALNNLEFSLSRSRSQTGI